MATTYTDEFWVMDPANPPSYGDVMEAEDLTFVDDDDDGYLSPDNGDTINGYEITEVWEGDYVYVYMDGQYQWIEGVTFYTDGGPDYFTPIDGTDLSDAYFIYSTWVTVSTEIEISDLDPPCFAEGTLIRVRGGLKPVEALCVGDEVMTKDNGYQPIRWIGHRSVRAHGALAPIRIERGALGNERALYVSPQHRMLLSGWDIELNFGSDEILVAAKHLVNGTTICAEPRAKVTYYHFLFDAHEIIDAEGAWSESFHPGEQILTSNASVRRELFALFPELADDEMRCARETARPVIRRYEAAVLEEAAELAA